MRNKLKGFLLGFLVLCAVFGSLFTYFSLGTAENDMAETVAVSGDAVGSENSYVLRDYEGYVAIFAENNSGFPMTVTNIQISTLTEFDQLMLQTGMKVQSHERLVMILEDLGS